MPPKRKNTSPSGLSKTGTITPLSSPTTPLSSPASDKTPERDVRSSSGHQPTQKRKKYNNQCITVVSPSVSKETEGAHKEKWISTSLAGHMAAGPIYDKRQTGPGEYDFIFKEIRTGGKKSRKNRRKTKKRRKSKRRRRKGKKSVKSRRK